MNHPCNDWKCPEYNHGQCFGMGCRLNPMPAPSEPNTDENENTQEDEE